MSKNKLILASALIIMGLSIAGASCKNSVQSQLETSPTVAGTSTNESFFSADAKVMMFYSDYCSWCSKEKTVLAELAPSGYRVKPMNVGTDTSLWQKYSIEGTPTFIAPDGTRLVGYQDKDKMQAFLDKNK